jgi:small multidrug resistance family-3 protein
MLAFVRAFGLFILAAGCEIGGAYLIWQWQRAGRPVLVAVLGTAILFLYSLIQSAQAFGFGRAFAAYGGVFIITAMLWGWWVDGQPPDRWDWLGVTICFLGAAIIVGMPRS